MDIVDKYYIDLARKMAEESRCIRWKVGGIILTPEMECFGAWNGVPATPFYGGKSCIDIHNGDGFSFDPNDPQDRMEHLEFSRMNELHVEQFLIGKCASEGVKTQGANIYLTLSPCIDCAKVMLCAGIGRVIYIEKYDRPEICGIDFLENNGVEIEQYDVHLDEDSVG